MLNAAQRRRHESDLAIPAPEVVSEALEAVYRRSSLNYCGLLVDGGMGQRKIHRTHRTAALDNRAEAACDRLIALDKHPGLRIGKRRFTPFDHNDAKEDFASDPDVAAFLDANHNANYSSTMYFPFRDLSGALCVSRVVSRDRVLSAMELRLVHSHCFDVLERLQLGAQADDNIGMLTVRERECLIAAAKGLTEKQTGQQLSISHFTVRTHIESCKRKFCARNKLNAIISGLKFGEITTADIETD